MRPGLRPGLLRALTLDAPAGRSAVTTVRLNPAERSEVGCRQEYENNKKKNKCSRREEKGFAIRLRLILDTTKHIPELVEVGVREQ